MPRELRRLFAINLPRDTLQDLSRLLVINLLKDILQDINFNISTLTIRITPAAIAMEILSTTLVATIQPLSPSTTNNSEPHSSLI
jgi:hypothetical protein